MIVTTRLSGSSRNRAKPLNNLINIGLRSGRVILERLAHGRQMRRRRPAAAANDSHAGVPGQSSILRHQVRRTAVLDLAIDKLGDPAVPFGYQNIPGIGLIVHGENSAD